MYQLNPALRAFWATRKPYKLLKGGRFSSKTQDAGGMAAYLARNYSLKFLCIRQFQNRIADSVYTVVKEKIIAAGWEDEFDIGVSSIRHKKTGSEFLFYGIARNLNDIKGTEGVDICWIEEGEGLTEEQWQVIDPTIRKQGAEIWLLWNPDLITDFVQAKLPKLLGDACVIKHINYLENPFLSASAREKAERMKEVDPEDYEHIYLGVPRSNDDTVVIKRTWVQAAIDAHKHVKPLTGVWTGRKAVGYDVADDGDDKNAVSAIDGSIAWPIEEWKGGEDRLRESSANVKKHAEMLGAQSIGYDSIGVGAGTGSHLNSLGWRTHYKFNAAGAVVNPDKFYGETKIKNKDFFTNIKAQMWWMMADRFRNTYLAVTKGVKFPVDEMISLSKDCDEKLLEQLMVELCTPKRDFDNGGKVKVESKKDLKKRDVDSPNIADSLIIAASHGMLMKASMFDTV